MEQYDIVIVGAGLTGAMIAWKNRGKKILVLEKNNYIGGLCYTEKWENIDIHKFGCHIFHTNKKEVWDWANSIVEFKPFNLNIKAVYSNKIYSLPFNMNTFYELWGCTTPEEAERFVKTSWDGIINILVRGYSEKQWGRKLEDIPGNIIDRLPVRYTWDNNYFKDTYVGIPVGGYTNFIRKLFGGAEIRLGVEFLDNKKYWESLGKEVYYTGPIDDYYDNKFGSLEYRCLRHEHTIYDTDNYQGCPVMNYTSKEIPWTRIIEHKHFLPGVYTEGTWVTKEFPCSDGNPAYPIEDENNKKLYNLYANIPNDKVHFCGRMGEYKYYNMNDIIEKYL